MKKAIGVTFVVLVCCTLYVVSERRNPEFPANKSADPRSKLPVIARCIRPPQTLYFPDETIVGFERGVNQTVREGLLRRYNLTRIRGKPEISVEVLKLDPDRLDDLPCPEP